MPDPAPTFTIEAALAIREDERLRRRLAGIIGAAQARQERNRLVIEWAGELMAFGRSGREASHQIEAALKNYRAISWIREQHLATDKITLPHRRLHAILRLSRGQKALGWSRVRDIIADVDCLYNNDTP